MREFYRTLSDEKVALEPLTTDHIESLKEVCGDEEIWRWFTVSLSDPSDMAVWMNQLLTDSEQGKKMTFAVRLLETGNIIGASSYGNIEWKEKNIEIGWTWIGNDYIGSGINKHMKFQMLSHAFDNMEMERLELRTDELNVRSRRAMEKIGAKHDATLRSHRYTKGGRRRNSVVYSILREEWPEVKAGIFKDF
ncbi:MAG: GNAT family N-acetyltransferase [Cyclobacteriaceae bacterium]